MYQTIDSINPKWIGDLVYGNRDRMTREEHLSLDKLVVTIEAVSCAMAFGVYNDLMDCSFFVEDSLNPDKFRLQEFLYVGPDSAQFSIACRLKTKNS